MLYISPAVQVGQGLGSADSALHAVYIKFYLI
jgi:hypothetical protein